MKRPALLTLATVLLFSLTIATDCPAQLRTDVMGGTGGGPIDGYLNVRVVQDGTVDPISGAFVMVGPAEGVPFSSNWGFTSGSGEITFVNAALQGPIDVTVGAAGYRYFSLISVDADDLIISLKPRISSETLYQVGDFVSGIDVNNGTFNLGDGNVDMALVLRSLSLSEDLSFDFAAMLGPLETIDILGQSFDIPSNIFIPQQWEILVEIRKDHYFLNLPEGQHTLAALSARIPRDTLLSGGAIIDLIADLDWREIDILDITVTGDTLTADLNVAPDLVDTVTLNLANIPDDSIVWGISVGDLDALHGMGRGIPLGIGTLDCPPGTGSCSGALTLSTTAASGEFSGMDYFPMAAVQANNGTDSLIVTDRSSHSQTYTVTLDSFFQYLDLYYSRGFFSWNDVENPAAGSPPVDLQTARVLDAGTGEVYWEFMAPEGVTSLRMPFLPAAAPAGPSGGSHYTWELIALGLAYDLGSFDFNSFAFTDILAHTSHMALDSTEIVWPTKNLSRVGAELGYFPF